MEMKPEKEMVIFFKILEYEKTRELKLHTQKRSTLVDFIITPPFLKERFFSCSMRWNHVTLRSSAICISRCFFHYVQ